MTGTTPVNIEVFRTSIEHPAQASYLHRRLQQHYPQYQINFDLEDCDRILRIVADTVIDEKGIIRTAADMGLCVEVLEG